MSNVGRPGNLNPMQKPSSSGSGSPFKLGLTVFNDEDLMEVIIDHLGPNELKNLLTMPLHTQKQIKDAIPKKREEEGNRTLNNFQSAVDNASQTVTKMELCKRDDRWSKILEELDEIDRRASEFLGGDS